MDKKIKIAVIDTYVNVNDSCFKDIGIHIHPSYTTMCDEKITHGTLVCSVLAKRCKNIEITVFPIFDSTTYEADIDDIIDTLLIIGTQDYDLVNLSMGTCFMDRYKDLKRACDDLAKQGAILVAAYDNNGLLSIPAVFESVIGVDASEDSLFGYEFNIVKNSEVNVRGGKKSRRININDSFVMASGSSFFTPYITGLIANRMKEVQKKLDQDEAIKFLELKAKKVINEKQSDYNVKSNIEIKRAIVLPFNKENHILARFSDMLNFEILDFYDFKHFFRCGKSIEDILECKLNNNYIIKNIDDIDYSLDFDTIIIGHINKIVNVIGDDAIRKILMQCSIYNKKIYAYDDFLIRNYEELISGVSLYYPYVSHNMLPNQRYGKLWDISSPVLGIFGTRTQQGKCTIQQMVRQALNKRGYKCGYLCTEPTGYLLGADECFPYGYNSSVDLTEVESIIYINEKMHNIDLKDPDLILVGGQSGIVPYDLGNMERILLSQTTFIFGSNPDAVLMCVCCDDEIEYIKRSIEYMESSCSCTVISLILFPVVKEMYFIGVYKDKNIFDTVKYDEHIKQISKETSKPVLEFSEKGIDQAVNLIVDFFSNNC